MRVRLRAPKVAVRVQGLVSRRSGLEGKHFFPPKDRLTAC